MSEYIHTTHQVYVHVCMYLLLGLVTVTSMCGAPRDFPICADYLETLLWRHYCSDSCIVGYVARVVMLEGTNLITDFWSFGSNLSFPSSRMFPEP